MNYLSRVEYILNVAEDESEEIRDLSCDSSPLKTLRLWRERRAERRALKDLSARLLQDIGLSEAARANEVNKPFWKA